MRNITAPHNTGAPSVWSSPVPFLLGGVGSMIALIAFALILLACSYLKAPRGSNSEENNVRSGLSNDSTVPSGEKEETLENILSSCSEDKQLVKVVVIMAGNDTPTFIANPTSASAK